MLLKCNEWGGWVFNGTVRLDLPRGILVSLHQPRSLSYWPFEQWTLPILASLIKQEELEELASFSIYWVPNRKKKVLKHSSRKTVVFYEYFSFFGRFLVSFLVDRDPYPSWRFRDAPSLPGVSSPFPWEHSGWRQLEEMPQKASTLWNMFPNSFLIWVEQLGLLVPVEVQLAAPWILAGRKSSASQGFIWRSGGKAGACLQGLPATPHPRWGRSPSWGKRKAREWEVSIYSTTHAFPPHYLDFIILAPLTLATSNLAPKWWWDGQRG